MFNAVANVCAHLIMLCIGAVAALILTTSHILVNPTAVESVDVAVTHCMWQEGSCYAATVLGQEILIVK